MGRCWERFKRLLPREVFDNGNFGHQSPEKPYLGRTLLLHNATAAAGQQHATKQQRHRRGKQTPRHVGPLPLTSLLAVGPLRPRWLCLCACVCCWRLWQLQSPQGAQ
ncbi:uncharacterized protein Tco025E_08526 [Trypanosoma conorhini]|uniref:Uncharacterized protein n=1 Tax=Trypanosoma conorhini TaxID=83891 RepID=A0A422N8D6_9TRYP|nr:uncharacterized protein Tco025E_08526 [Trypanosoma conorhini]RNF01749.1 hypothetical protein Tco025E_08526 [Trypanosoma conorhini]